MVSGDEVAKYIVCFNMEVSVRTLKYILSLAIGMQMYEAIARVLWNFHRHVRSLEEWTEWVEEHIADFDIQHHRAENGLPSVVEGDIDV